MSHIVTIKTEVRDETAIRAACQRLALQQPIHESVQLFSGTVIGLAVHLPGWRYPVVCHTASGQLWFDDYGGQWGEQAQLDRFLQAYAVEKVRIEARRGGHTVTEQPLADGSIKLSIQTGA